MKKQLISQALESHLSELVSMSDQIYDFAEPGMEEIQSSRLLTEYLKAKGFEVECGIAGLPTAFRAVYEQGSGGPSFGFLAEYDAIKDIGHACGHHIQGSTMSVSNKSTSWIIDNTYVTSISSLPALVSQNFTWEKVGTVNVGLDINLFNNRLNGVFEWYQRNTNGMLAPGVQLPAVVGASAPYQNTADMRTRGWELSLNWRDQIGKVGYRLGFNLSDYKSKITKYDDNATTKLLSSFYPGQVMGEIWGYVADGYYSVDDFEDTSSWKLKEGITSINGYNVRPGDVKFKNLRDDESSTNVITSGDNTFDNPGDRKVIGNTTPRYQYGINLGANYAGFDLNVILQGTGKRDYWISNVLTFPMNGDNFIPLFDGLSDYWMPKDPDNGDWTAVNPNAKYPRLYGNRGNSGSNLRQSDKYLSDASYLRIKNITLSYNLPKKWLSQIFLSQMKAFVSVENVATFTSLPSGIDPERIEWNYPAFRTVSFGINITL